MTHLSMYTNPMDRRVPTLTSWKTPDRPAESIFSKLTNLGGVKAELIFQKEMYAHYIAIMVFSLRRSNGK